MRAKRSKQYKKLVQQYQLHHGFREPYQVLVDADIVLDAQRFTMDLQAGLERTLHGKVKIMITQCSIRHLYAKSREPSVSKAIDAAKAFERRRCGHRPEDFEEALPALDCLKHVVDEKGRGENKHRYVVASQDQSVRRYMRGVSGVPLIYINRSVMIMEPMSESTARVGASAERAKFRSELRKKAAGEKRKRETEEEAEEDDDDNSSDEDHDAAGDDEQAAAAKLAKDNKKKKGYGPKGPNPLAVKKKKTAKPAGAPAGAPAPPTTGGAAAAAKPKTAESDAMPKKKRKRKHKAATDDGDAGEAAAGADA